VRLSGTEHRVRFEPYEGGVLAHLDDCPPADLVGRWRPGQLRFRGTIDGRARTVAIARKGRQWRLTARGASHLADIFPEHVAALSRHMIEKVPPDLSRFLICPMPGLLTALHVGEGEEVQAGQPLAVVEAMKMENILRAEKSATVKATQAKAGDSLAVDQVIVEFE
jgi:propionyl-CoA carboxylase alpha chain